MLKWKIEIGNEKLSKEIERVKNMFDKWFEDCWSDKCTKEEMLSEKSPLKHVYYKMTKSFDEVKKEFPYEAIEECLACGKDVDEWIAVSYEHYDKTYKINLCKKCANELKQGLDEFTK